MTGPLGLDTERVGGLGSLRSPCSLCFPTRLRLRSSEARSDPSPRAGLFVILRFTEGGNVLGFWSAHLEEE